jgi:hypothetical protein
MFAWTLLMVTPGKALELIEFAPGLELSEVIPDKAFIGAAKIPKLNDPKISMR